MTTVGMPAWLVRLDWMEWLEWLEWLKWLEWRFLEKNVTVSIVILAVFAARFLLRRFPKKYAYVLWSVVGIRMLVDLPVQSVFSLFHLLPVDKMCASVIRRLAQWGMGYPFTTAGMTAAAGGQTTGEIIQISGSANGIAGALGAAAGIEAQSADMAMQTATGAVQSADMAVQPLVVSDFSKLLQYGGTALIVLFMIYLIGVYVILMLGEISYLRFKSRTRQAVRLRENIWECDYISTPFVLGFLAPKIYIPFHMDRKSQVYVLEHERYHIRKGDPWIKLAAYILLAVYWCNPLVWLAYAAFVRDQEMRCDEAVIRMFGNGSRQEYSELLLHFAVEQKRMFFSPNAFGESEVTRRIQNVLQHKTTGIRTMFISVSVIAGIFLGCLTSQTQSDSQDETRGDIISMGGTRESISVISAMEAPGEQQGKKDGMDGRDDRQGESVDTGRLYDRQTVDQSINATGINDSRMEEVQAKLARLAELYAKVGEQETAREQAYAVREIAWQEATGGFEGWAKAMAGRDVETILDLSTKEVQQQMEAAGELVRGMDGLFLQDNGIWTMYDANAYQVLYSGWGGVSTLNESRLGSAVICYAVPKQDLRVVSCIETIKVRRNWPNEAYRMEVYEENMNCYDDISDCNSFEEAYPGGIISVLDYAQNGYGEIMNALATKEPDRYSELFDPLEAARFLLNLNKNAEKVQLSMKSVNEDCAVVEVMFTFEGKTRDVMMRQPWGEKGIWVPGGYY